MGRVILKPTETVSEILDEQVEGYYQLDCSPFVAPVKMQYSNDQGETWIDGYFNGTLIQFEEEGAILDQTFAHGRYYRYITTRPGSQITMFKHHEAGG